MSPLARNPCGAHETIKARGAPKNAISDASMGHKFDIAGFYGLPKNI